MARPKSSTVGLVSGGLDLYSAVKIRRMSNEIENLQRANALGTAITLSEIGNLQDMNAALQIQMAECDRKLETLSRISWRISDYFDRKEMQDEFIATMRYSVHMMNRELDLIDTLVEDTPEYALWKVDRLLEVIEERDVKAEHFARVSQDEMTSAQNLLDRAEGTRISIKSILEASDGN